MFQGSQATETLIVRGQREGRRRETFDGGDSSQAPLDVLSIFNDADILKFGGLPWFTPYEEK